MNVVCCTYERNVVVSLGEMETVHTFSSFPITWKESDEANEISSSEKPDGGKRGHGVRLSLASSYTVILFSSSHFYQIELREISVVRLIFC